MKKLISTALLCAALVCADAHAESVGNSTCNAGAGTLSQDIYTAWKNDTSRNGFSSPLSSTQQSLLCSQVWAFSQYMNSTTPTGTPNGAAYFDGTGALGSNTSCSTGQVFACNSNGTAAPTFQTVSSGWATGYALDFTAQATQNLVTGGDGNKTIDGKTWVLSGSANATTAGITNGTGLVLTLANTNSITLYAKLTSLISTINPIRDDLLVMVHFNCTVMSSNNSWMRFGWTDTANPGTNTWGSLVGPRNSSSTGVNQWRSESSGEWNQTTAGGVQTTTVNTTDNVAAFLLKDARINYALSGTWSSGFPAWNALTTFRQYDTLVELFYDGSNASFVVPKDMGFRLSLASATGASCTVLHMTVYART